MAYMQPSIQPLTSLDSLLNCLFPPIEKIPHGADWRIKELQSYINRHEGKLGGDLDRVCRELALGISWRHAARLFRHSFGIGIRKYAKKRRQKAAVERLKLTALSVKEIAADLGYRNNRQFERVFRELFHLNPTEFRKFPLNGGDVRKPDHLKSVVELQEPGVETPSVHLVSSNGQSRSLPSVISWKR